MLSNLERMASWSAKAAQRLQADDEGELFRAYREISLLVRDLRYGTVTVAQAGISLDEAKALEAARKAAWFAARQGL